jgi:hypothetical protein
MNNGFGLTFPELFVNNSGFLADSKIQNILGNPERAHAESAWQNSNQLSGFCANCLF